MDMFSLFVKADFGLLFYLILPNLPIQALHQVQLSVTFSDILLVKMSISCKLLRLLFKVQPPRVDLIKNVNHWLWQVDLQVFVSQRAQHRIFTIVALFVTKVRNHVINNSLELAKYLENYRHLLFFSKRIGVKMGQFFQQLHVFSLKLQHFTLSFVKELEHVLIHQRLNVCHCFSV